MKSFVKFLYKIGFFEFVFYGHAIVWLATHKKPKQINPKLALNIFLKFLRVQKKDCQIVELTKNQIIFRWKNKCPVLDISKYLKIDTKKSCKKISEPVCRFFLNNISKKIEFKRNYNCIRPYQKSCEEVITILKS
jgi:hypothetical protein